MEILDHITSAMLLTKYYHSTPSELSTGPSCGERASIRGLEYILFQILD